jgi:uncharacterized membrane protein
MEGATDEPGEDDETPLEQTVARGVMALIFVVGFGLMFAGVPYFWVAFPVGFAGVLPMALGLVKYYERRQDGDDTSSDETEDALETLRQRYARGDLTDDEFERRVERLLETESVTDARQLAERGRTEEASGTGDQHRERERE